MKCLIAWTARLSVLTVAASLYASKAPFKLRLLHTNDMHSRFEQVSQSAGKCSDYEASNNLCYGGFARVKAVLEDELANAQKDNTSVLSLNAGDTYQGTVWYSVFKWKVVNHFLNMLKIDAMCLGNHEFDDGIKGLAPFLHAVNITTVAGNIDLSLEPDLGETPLKNSEIFERQGRKIGVIGYLTPETVVLAETGKLKFRDEIESLTEEATRLRKAGIDVVIALGHSGYETDLKIAKEVPGIDVVVGGHSHSLFYSGTPPDSEKPVCSYPTMVIQASGRKVAVVQAYAFTKYLGKLDLTFDENGELKEATGNPILLNHKIREDPSVLKEINLWKEKLNSSLKEKLGNTKVFLDGSQCRFFECNLGNLITDAYIHHGAKSHSGPFWTNAGIAIQQAGGIRASINATGSNGTITREDVITSMPFFSSLSVVGLLGKHLLEALEWSVARYDVALKTGRGEFLQVSGLKLKFDPRKPVGSRVVSVRARCSECLVPSFRELRAEERYNVIMPTFLLKGGDNFTIFKEKGQEIDRLDISDTEVAIKYIEEMKMVYSGLEDRIEMTKSFGFTNKPNFIYFFLIILISYFK